MLNSKQIQISNDLKPKQYDLEERTFIFANQVRGFIEKLSRSIANTEDIKQLVRASGSVGANYIEANEALSKKDFIYRIKLCRKEAKESRLFLRLVDTNGEQIIDEEGQELINESVELMKIFGSIIVKTEGKSSV